MDLDVRLEFQSDWHVGSGTSTAEVDALVARDPFGFPHVPAKSLTGLWRQQFEAVAAAMASNDGAWRQLPDVIFGTQPNLSKGAAAGPPVPARLAVSPLRVRPSVREAIRAGTGTPVPLDITVVRPGVRIDPATGTAMDKFLRNIEHGRAGTVLHGTATVDLDGFDAEARSAVLAALVAAATLIERAGGNRRRGAGRCSVQVATDGETRDGTWAAGILDGASAPTVIDQAQAPPTTSTPPADDETISVPLRLVLGTPVGATSQVSGNLHETHDHLPGSVILAWAAQRLQRAGARDLRAAIVGGRFRVAPATVEIAGKRSLPSPGSYGQAKGAAPGPGAIANRLVERLPGEVQVKDLRGGWVASGDDGRVHRRTVPTVIHAHNTIDDAKQRPTSDVGGLYLYEAISPVWPDGSPMVLRTELTVPLGAVGLDRESVVEALVGTARLGRSSKDDYGLVEVQIADGPSPESGVDPAEAASVEDGRFVLWCTSDVLLDASTPGGLPTLGDVRDAVERGLGLDQGSLEVVSPNPDQADTTHLPEGAWLRHRRIDSFHTRWQRPRPTMLAVAAGTVITFHLAAPPADLEDRLRRLEAGGIGRRRAEGFGEITFDHPLALARLGAVGLADAPAPGSMGETDGSGWLDGAERAHVATVVDAWWQRRIIELAQQRALDAAARKELLGGYADASRSQQGTLRSLLAGFGGMLHDPDPSALQADKDRVNTWLAKEKRRANNPERSRGRIPTDALTKLIADAPHVWAWLGLEREVDGERASVPEDVKDRLWAFAVRVSVESALRAKQAKAS